MAGSGGGRGLGWLVVVGLMFTMAVVWAPTGVSGAKKLTCYNFTWAGDENSTKCDDITKRSPPCFYPLVFTDPPNRPPDLQKLDEHCAANDCPNYKCTKEKSCVRYNYWDVNNQLMNYTLFCSTVADITYIDSTGVKPVTNGCWKEKLGTVMREMCVCDDRDLCNLGHATRTSVVGVGLGLVLVLVLGRMW